MKTLGTLVVALALALSVQTAQAHIVQFVTAVPMTVVDGVPDEAAVSNIILTAVKDALRQAVAFLPTLVVVEDARVVGGHLYLLVLAADSEGETLMQELENARAAVERGTPCDASPVGEPGGREGRFKATPRFASCRRGEAHEPTRFRPASKISRILRAITLLPIVRFMDPPTPVTWSVKAWVSRTTTVPSGTGRKPATACSPL